MYPFELKTVHSGETNQWQADQWPDNTPHPLETALGMATPIVRLLLAFDADVESGVKKQRYGDKCVSSCCVIASC